MDTKFSEIHAAARHLVKKFPNFLFSPEVTPYACPYPRSRIWIVRDKKSLAFNDLNLALVSRLQHLGLQDGKYMSVSLTILQCCLRFSIQTRLCPTWNHLGCFLIHQPNFLELNRIEAVRPELRVAGDTGLVYLGIDAKILRWYRLDLDDLEIDPDIRIKFESQLVSTIPASRMNNRQLLVLPNLTRGRVHSITRKLMPCLAIKDYSDMRLYWHNVHGYELPQEEPKFFCNVFFSDSMSDIFCYPETCVRVLEPFAAPITDNIRQSITNSFLDSMTSLVSTVCKRPLNFKASQAMQTTSDITPASTDQSGLQPKPLPQPEQPKYTPQFVVQACGDGPSVQSVAGSSGQPTQTPAGGTVPTPPKPIVPVFKPTFTAGSLPQTITNSTEIRTAPFKPVFSAGKPSAATSKVVGQKVPSDVPKTVSPTTETSTSQTSSTSMPLKPLFSMPKPVLTQNKPKAAKRPQQQKKPSKPERPSLSQEAESASGSGVAAAKRPKSAPVVRQDLDIAALASVPTGLAKVNVATLIDWCKKNGVHTLSKDKKEDIVRKIRTKLNISHEP